MDDAAAPTTPNPPPTPAAPAPAAPADPQPKGRRMRMPKFDNLLEPVRRLWSRDQPDAVMPTGSVNRVRHRDPRVLFVCTGNASRSQMAEAFAAREGLYAESAGTWPAPGVLAETVEAMKERGFDLAECRPKLLDPTRLAAFDRVVLFEARIPDAWREGARIEEWNDVWDPAGLPLEGHRMVATELEKRIARLAKLLKGKPAGTPGKPLARSG